MRSQVSLAVILSALVGLASTEEVLDKRQSALVCALDPLAILMRLNPVNAASFCSSSGVPVKTPTATVTTNPTT